VTDYTSLAPSRMRRGGGLVRLWQERQVVLPFFEDTAARSIFAYSGIKPLLAGRWIIAHKGMVFFKQAFFA